MEDAVPLTAAQRAELDRRLDDLEHEGPARDLSVSRGMRSHGGFRIAFREADHLPSIRRSGFGRWVCLVRATEPRL